MPARLNIPRGLPTASPIDDSVAWTSLFASQLTDVRKCAENWRNGLAAMIGLITGFSVIKGPEDVSGLEPWAAITVGVLILLSISVATYGAWKSVAAAYGTPRVITSRDFHKEGGIDGLKLVLATQAVKDLLHARRATIAALVLLTAAVGFTWYGPHPKSAILEVERKSLPKVCGKLISSADGYMDIQPSHSQAVRVYMKDVVKVSVVEECP